MMVINDVSHAVFDDYAVFDLDEELYRAFLEDDEEWSTAHQVFFLIQLVTQLYCYLFTNAFS